MFAAAPYYTIRSDARKINSLSSDFTCPKTYPF